MRGHDSNLQNCVWYMVRCMWKDYKPWGSDTKRKMMVKKLLKNSIYKKHARVKMRKECAAFLNRAVNYPWLHFFFFQDPPHLPVYENTFFFYLGKLSVVYYSRQNGSENLLNILYILGERKKCDVDSVETLCRTNKAKNSPRKLSRLKNV